MEASRLYSPPFLPTFDPEVALKFFEFPTEAKFAGKIIGRFSMTAIMILDPDWQIAIEGKFTDYLFAAEKRIVLWLRENAAGRLDAIWMAKCVGRRISFSRCSA